MVRKNNIVRFLLGIGAMSLIISSCSSSKSDSGATSSSGITISGALNLNSSSSFSKMGDDTLAKSDFQSFAATDYKIECTSIDDSSSKVTASVNSDGSFSVAGVAKNAVGCQILDGSGTALAPIVFEDSSSKDMKGKSKTQSRLQLQEDASIGSISFSPTSKTASVTMSSDLKTKISASKTDHAAPYDFTGSYKMAKWDGTLPTGYSMPCAAGESNCNGPSVDEPIFIKVLKGKSFSPDATCSSAATAGTITGASACNGATGADDKYGVSIWKAEAAYQACGSKLGFSYVEGKAYGQIDLSNSGITEGAYTWSTSGSGGSTIANGWQFSNAVTGYQVPNCEPVSVGSGSNTVSGYKCYDNVSSPASYQVSLAKGGCLDGNNQPIENINWTNVTYGSNTRTDYDTANFPGYKKDVTTATYNSSSLTCTFIWGTFKQSDNASLNGAGFDWNNVTKIATGTACSTLANTTNKEKLNRLQCYANALYNVTAIRTDMESNSLCLRKVRANWGATDPNSFLTDSSGPQKAEAQHVLELLEYTSSDSASFRMRDDDYRGVQNGSSWTTCHLEKAITISMKKRADGSGNVNIEFISETKNLDAGIAACKSSETNLGIGTQKFMFKAVKQ